MTWDDLAKACIYAHNQGLTGIMLVVPGPPPRGRLVRLDRGSRRKCPMGDIGNWQDDPPRTIARFNPLEILAWLAATNRTHPQDTP